MSHYPEEYHHGKGDGKDEIDPDSFTQYLWIIDWIQQWPLNELVIDIPWEDQELPMFNRVVQGRCEYRRSIGACNRYSRPDAHG